ncbi:YbcC family protein [Marinobacter koreensis]|uniref:Probable inorganic carbon transporter subunit DabA n=1 Tax=Marinobacter koreensis TaxID=335974 RepID=A0ABW0RG38_9GAMM|nr:DUF2309 domain-containing protein [Marinobacter koreensis]MCK7548371.1 DUF2309 domain-containing protein [Marinobacter koreensis]
MNAKVPMTLSMNSISLMSEVCETIAPTWPLDRWIAVNPWWGLRQLSAVDAAETVARNAGVDVLMPFHFYRTAWEGGRIREEDLRAALSEQDHSATLERLVASLDQDDPINSEAISAMEHLPETKGRSPAIELIQEQIGRACASYFDQRQARWNRQSKDHGLYAHWRDLVARDPMIWRNTGIPRPKQLGERLPQSWEESAVWAAEGLDLSEPEFRALAQRHLYGLIGWASWCRGVDWREMLEGRDSFTCCELLTIFLAWERWATEALPVEGKATLQRARKRHRDRETGPDTARWVWQRAYELAWKRSLEQKLKSAANLNTGKLTPAVQAVFCIDVRSEVIRRHLEAGRPGIQTLGFAGFFGIPVTHQKPGPGDEEPRLPGLLAPRYRFNEMVGTNEENLQLNRRLDQREMNRETVRRAKYSSLSTFTLVETTGLAWGWKLVRDSLNRNGSRSKPDQGEAHGRLHHVHGGDPVGDLERIDLAENLLRGMSLTDHFASLLLFVGHGSHTDNNPNEAGLACGACGGKNGGVNARIAAELINDRAVRAGLVARGIQIPDFCHAVAAEHCTVTDRVRILDRHTVPDSHLIRLQELEEALADAGQAARRERACALGLNGLSDDGLLKAVEKRTVNWAEVRPEWGLANNAAIIFAKRSRSRGTDLGGRCFLHDYDPDRDPEGKILAGLMTAPMVVANWINLQYYASVVSPEVYGAGNKLLHSVVGGNIGVIEGNGADLRIGLPIQSVHDGRHWRHEPMRLTVVIDAPETRIRQILNDHDDVAALVRNQWLWLYRLGADGELVAVEEPGINTEAGQSPM